MLKYAYELGVALAFEEAHLSKEAGLGDWAARNLPTFTTWANKLFRGGTSGMVSRAAKMPPALVRPQPLDAASRSLAKARVRGQVSSARVNPSEFGQVSSPFAISNQQIGQAMKGGVK